MIVELWLYESVSGFRALVKGQKYISEWILILLKNYLDRIYRIIQDSILLFPVS
jgi:hypothetical protein